MPFQRSELPFRVQAASETLRGSVISYKRGEKPSCGQHLAAARWPAVFSSMSMGFDANPRSSADAGKNQGTHRMEEYHMSAEHFRVLNHAAIHKTMDFQLTCYASVCQD